MAAGDKEIILASEEVQKRNIDTMLQYTRETRMMLKELRVMHDALQNKYMALNDLFEQQRKQLAHLQQQFYAKGTVSLN